MVSSPGFSTQSTRKPPAALFSGGAPDAAKTPTPQQPAAPASPAANPAVNPAADPQKKLGFWETIKTLRLELKNAKTREFLKGVAYKYLPDLTMSSLFAIPVLGWAAGIVAAPFNAMLATKGEKIIQNTRKDLDRKGNKVHNGIHHSLNMQDAWGGEGQFFGKKKRPLSEYLAVKYNKTLAGLFSDSPALQNRLKINWENNSRAFRTIKRFTEARQALRQTPMLGKLFNWMSGLGNVGGGMLTKALPKPAQLLLFIPRMGLLSIYFLLGRKPKFKA